MLLYLKNFMDKNLVDEVVAFTTKNLLFWIEVLSVSQSISNAAPALGKLADAWTAGMVAKVCILWSMYFIHAN